MKTYRFSVYYETKRMQQVNEFLRKCDIYQSDTGTAIEETIRFNYTGKNKPISYFKDLIKQAYEQLECKVVLLEGGIIE